MAQPGVWSYGSSAIPTGAIKVKHSELYGNNWKRLEVNSNNYAVKNLETRITETGGIEFRYPTTTTNPLGCTDGSNQCTIANSIQEIADDSLYVARFKYSTDDTTKIQTAVLSQLNEDAQTKNITKSTTTTPKDRDLEKKDSDLEPESDIIPGFENIVDQTKNFDQLNFDNIKQYFTYPESMNDGQDRIVFTQYKYVATKISTDLKSTVESFANRNKELQTTKIEGSVTLPIPNQIAETNQTGWGESSLTTIGALAMGGLTKGGLNLSQFEVSKGINQLSNTVTQLGLGPVTSRAQSFLAAKFASQVISAVGITVDPEAYLNRVTGAAINPNLELLFNGPKLRPFSFSFKMTARSQKEAKNIRAIIKFFKAGMAPQRSKKFDASLYLGAPNLFQVEYKSNKVDKLDGIGRIKMCALQSCAINYTPDGAYAVYDDDLVGSQPIAIEMQLQLIEITPVFADEYNLEDDNVPIGPEGSGNFVIEPESNTQ